MKNSIWVWCLTLSLGVGCSSGSARLDGGAENPVDAGVLDGGSGDGGRLDAGLPAASPKYLTFQVMLGTPSAEVPLPQLDTGGRPPATLPLVKTPNESVAKLVDFIIRTVGATGSKRAKLGFVIGPLSLDLTDAELTASVKEAFALARSRDIAVGFHLDDSMFWSRSTLFTDANKEWTTSFDGSHPTTGLWIDWGMPASFPPRLCMGCAPVRAEVSRLAKDVVGAAIAGELAALKAEGREELFAGVIIGWESHMGRDAALTESGGDAKVGFHSLAEKGFGPSNQPNFGVEIAKVVKAHIELWADGLLRAGLPRAKLYSHINFLPKSEFLRLQQAGQIPPGVSYSDIANTAARSVESETAFGIGFNPGFSAYPTPGTLEEITEQIHAHGDPPWAQAEGTNAIPGLNGSPTEGGGQSMATYLAQRFERGATLVNVFAMGIGGEAQKDNPFRMATENAAAVAAYRAFLAQ